MFLCSFISRSIKISKTLSRSLKHEVVSERRTFGRRVQAPTSHLALSYLFTSYQRSFIVFVRCVCPLAVPRLVFSFLPSFLSQHTGRSAPGHVAAYSHCCLSSDVSFCVCASSAACRLSLPLPRPDPTGRVSPRPGSTPDILYLFSFYCRFAEPLHRQDA